MKISKKVIIFIIVLFLIVFLCCLFFIIMRNRKIENKQPIFKISKIILYSSADATDNSSDGLLQDLDINQFTDIAIYIDNRSNVQDLTSKNTVKEVSIYNIKLDASSDTGKKFINYKNPLSYGKFEPLQYNNGGITFDAITTNNENNEADYDSPVFFADCSNPISLGYLNLGILKNYNIPKDNDMPDNMKTILFDGSILKKADIKIEDLKCTLSFTIKIKNYLDEEFVCDVILNNIAGDSSIYNGYYTKEYTPQSSLYDFRKL